MRYQEFRAYSPTYGCEVSRFSMFDKNGAEFFIMLPTSAGKKWRETRTKAVEAIADAISRGDEPGEIKFT